MQMSDINPNLELQAGKLTAFMNVISKIPNLTNEDWSSLVADAVTQQLLTKDAPRRVSESERQEKHDREEEKLNNRNRLREWLLRNEGPSYNGDRQNARTVGEILDKSGIDHRIPGIQQMARNLLESESTGWGLVDMVDGRRLYGKKAALIAFRQVQEAAD